MEKDQTYLQELSRHGCFTTSLRTKSKKLDLYINLQSLIPMLRLKIVSSDKYDRDLILNFLNIVETIPLKDLTEKEIINIMYNYNIDQIYIDKLELNMKNLIS